MQTATRDEGPSEQVRPPATLRATQEPATIFIPVPYAINVRDVLRTEIFRSLKAAGHRLVILSPAHDDPDFVREFADRNVHIEPLYPYDPSTLEQKHRTLRFTLFSDLTETINMLSVPTHGRSLPKKVALGGARLITRGLGHRRMEDLLARIGLWAWPEHRYDSIFARYKPDLVVLTRVFGTSADHPVLKAAARLGVPTVLVVSSWDNLTSKGVFPARVDRVVVWNDIMADEAAELHGVDRKDIFIAGAPQFDIYADKSKLPDRETFFRKVGADPSKALITFALQNQKTCPDEIDVVALLYEQMRQGAIKRPCQLLVRVHPIGHVYGEVFPKSLMGLPDLLVDVPGTRKSQFADRDASPEDMKHLAATMWHSDVVLNSVSTIAIDAVALDTPVICVGFDGRRTLPPHQSVRRFHNMTHYRKLLDLGGIRVAHNLSELVSQINAYLDDPTLDAEGRQRIVQRECHALDGKAGLRIGNFILKTLAELRQAGRS
jgi:CDP-glycerol glycerophosphotransferase (TagB/SpsB family)